MEQHDNREEMEGVVANGSGSERGLVAIFAGLCVVAVVLVVAIVVVNLQSGQGDDGEEYDVGASERAMLFREEINQKLSSDPDYNPSQALEEYAKAYNESNGSYKTYIAIDYARYTCTVLEKCDLAIDIMEGVKPKEVWPEVLSYYGELVEIYDAKGDTEMAQYYTDLIQKMNEEGMDYAME